MSFLGLFKEALIKSANFVCRGKQACTSKLRLLCMFLSVKKAQNRRNTSGNFKKLPVCLSRFCNAFHAKTDRQDAQTHLFSDSLRVKKNVLTEKQLKRDKMWDLWTEGKIGTPYAELMTYQSEVNNGGHAQYFFNTENSGDLQKEMSALEQILSQVLKDNLLRAYQSYLVSEEDGGNEEAEKTIEACDAVYFENEKEVNQILEEYSEKIEL